jgi:hypothetical protein
VPVVVSPQALVAFHHNLQSMVVARPQALVGLHHDLQSMVAASF